MAAHMQKSVNQPERLPPAIVAEHVSRTYRTAAGPIRALQDLTVTVDSGDFVFLIGTSGSGKSTLLRLLIGAERADAGTLTVNGTDLGGLRRRHLHRFRSSIGTVFQDYRLLEERTVWENLAFCLETLGKRRTTVRTQVPALLELVGLSDAGRRYPRELSGGEQQRVAIARAFAGQPALLLADEPTGNLDPDNARSIVRLLERINRTGTTVIMATHDPGIVDRAEHRVIELAGGELVRDTDGGNYRTTAGGSQ